MRGRAGDRPCLRAVAAVVVMTLLASCAPGPSIPPSAGPSVSAFEPVPILDPRPTVGQGITMESVTPRWGPTPDGPGLLDVMGEQPQTLNAGKRVAVLGDPLPGPGGTWVPVWVVPDQETWPADFFAWVPATQPGRPTLRLVPSATCPALATIGGLAPLLAPDRLRCLGGKDITVEAKTWYPGLIPAYDTDPAWYGTNGDVSRTVSLFDGGPTPFGKGAPVAPADRAGFIDARVPPAVAIPPLGMVVRVTGHFDDSTAPNCTRTYRPSLNPGDVLKPGWGFPPEGRADSVEWCREQFVVGSWTVALGPEGRPIDLSRPQLHRAPIFDLPPGAVIGCGGVGMPPLRIRIDLTAIDPVWIDVAGGRIAIARFSRAFQLAIGDVPRVIGSNGITMMNGEVLDPDRGKPGLDICPEGDVVDFRVPGVVQ